MSEVTQRLERDALGAWKKLFRNVPGVIDDGRGLLSNDIPSTQHIKMSAPTKPGTPKWCKSPLIPLK